MQVRELATRSGLLRVHPAWKPWLESHGLTDAQDFLQLEGVVVSGHVGRNVSRICIGGETCFLKREHRVRLRDRLRSWWEGFGPTSVSSREACVLNALESHDLPGPICFASGECQGQAFLLVPEVRGGVELRSLKTIVPELACQLGQRIADLHQAGIDQPDLFAKHVLLQPDSGEVTILDWQRARIRRRVPLSSRIRSLACLRATCPEATLPRDHWHALIDAYCETSGLDSRVVASGVESLSARLAHRPAIRRQLVSAHIRQDLVRIQGETVCAIPEVAGELSLPEVMEALHDPANNGRAFRFHNGRSGILRVNSYKNPLDRWWSRLRGKTWRSPELRQARLLFHLERHGILAPRLLAYGQTAHSAFCLAEPADFQEVVSSDGPALRQLLDQLHGAECVLEGNPFGMQGPSPIVARPEYLNLQKRISPARIDRDRRLIETLTGSAR